MELSGNTFFFSWEVSLMAWLQANIYDISAQGYSFPSAHSTNAVSVFGSLAVNLRKRWFTVIAIMIPLLTGISRFVVGAHYPTDVMAGCIRYAIIAFVDFGVYPMLFKFEKRKCFNKI